MIRALAIACFALAGCDAVFGQQFRGDAGTADGTTGDAMTGEAPFLEVPSLSPADAPQPANYLVEGTGWHAGAPSLLVPFVIRNLRTDDVVPHRPRGEQRERADDDDDRRGGPCGPAHGSRPAVADRHDRDEEHHVEECPDLDRRCKPDRGPAHEQGAS